MAALNPGWQADNGQGLGLNEEPASASAFGGSLLRCPEYERLGLSLRCSDVWASVITGHPVIWRCPRMIPGP